MARFDLPASEKAEMAAGAGDSQALFNLGLMYCLGREVDPDLVAAHKWFNLAAARGNREALRYRSEIAGEMSPDEIAEAQRQARHWLTTH